MKLGKPPVVEVWISFRFDPNEKKREWDIGQVRRFIDLHNTELPKLEAIHEREVNIEEGLPTELPRVLSRRVSVKAVRIFNESRTRILQIRDDEISVHMIRAGADYPGFLHLRDEAIAKLRSYMEVFQPVAVRSASLHYVDLVEIPSPENQTIELTDYFITFTDLPAKPFGLVHNLAVEYTVNCPVDSGPLVLKMSSLPFSEAMFRFRLEWHKYIADVGSLEIEKIVARLNSSHDYLRDCFWASLRSRTVDLFEPIPEE